VILARVERGARDRPARDGHLNIGVGFGDFQAGSFISVTAGTQFYRGPYFAINFKDAGRAEQR
jgi:hypothetical protein